MFQQPCSLQGYCSTQLFYFIAHKPSPEIKWCFVLFYCTCNNALTDIRHCVVIRVLTVWRRYNLVDSLNKKAEPGVFPVPVAFPRRVLRCCHKAWLQAVSSNLEHHVRRWPGPEFEEILTEDEGKGTDMRNCDVDEDLEHCNLVAIATSWTSQELTMMMMMTTTTTTTTTTMTTTTMMTMMMMMMTGSDVFCSSSMSSV